MKLIPVITEKSMIDAKKGRYTFIVDRTLSKPEIKREVEATFGVHVVTVNTSKKGGETKKNFKGYRQTRLSVKKARVTLQEKESISLFEEKKK